MRSSQPDLARICVAGDGRVKAQFGDSSLLLLSASGRTFVHCNSVDGSRVQQMSEFAVSRYTDKLAQVLRFRNMHVDVPFYCSCLSKDRSGGEQMSFRTGYEIHSVRWPRSCCEGKSQVPNTNSEDRHPNGDVGRDGSVMVRSEEGFSRILLHPGGRRFSVTYPFLIQRNKETFDYIWQNQVFSIESSPQRWKPGLDLALEIQQSCFPKGTEIAKSTVESEKWNCSETRCSSGCIPQRADPPMEQGTVGERDAHTESGRNQQFSDGEKNTDTDERCSTITESRSLDRTSQLPLGHPSGGSPDRMNFPEKSWWLEPTAPGVLPHNDAIAIDWTPIAMYEYIPEQQEVGVWLHAQEEYLRTVKGGKFIRHFRMPKAEDRTYAASALPRSVWSHGGNNVCPLESIAKHALQLRHEHARLREECATEQSLLACKEPMVRSRPSVSNSIVEQHTADGLGSFTAYQDGRVRVCFDDRTLLNMDASHSNCSIILSSGKHVSVRVDMPIGAEPYVESALDFADWAYKTPAERGNTLNMRLEIQRTAERCARAAAICDWALSKKLPVSATRYSGSVVPVGESAEALGGQHSFEMSTDQCGHQGGYDTAYTSLHHNPQGHYDHCGPTASSDIQSAVQSILNKTNAVLGKMAGGSRGESACHRQDAGVSGIYM